MRECFDEYLKLLTTKKSIIVGLLNIFISISLLSINIYDIFELEFLSNKFLGFFCIALGFSIMMFFFIDLVFSCLESIIIILIKNLFDFRELYFVNFLFLSQILLLNTLTLISLINGQDVKLSFAITFFEIPLILLYYYTLTKKTFVDKKAARLLSLILLLLLLISYVVAF